MKKKAVFLSDYYDYLNLSPSEQNSDAGGCRRSRGDHRLLQVHTSYFITNNI